MKLTPLLTAGAILALFALPAAGQNAITRSLFDPDLYPALNGGFDVTLQSGDTLAIDTSALTITRNGASLGTGVVGNTAGPTPQAVALFTFTNLTIPSGVTVTLSGTRPLGLLARQDMSIGSSLSVAGNSGLYFGNATHEGAAGRFGGGGGGAAGQVTAAAGSGPGGGGSVTNDSYASGSGGGFGGNGQAGAAPGGITYGSADLADLFGGSGGGGGTGYSGFTSRAYGGSGGGGGGALCLIAQRNLVVTAAINASGGEGGDGSFSQSYGHGGGGSGGAVLLAAPSLSLTGTVTADGEPGGYSTSPYPYSGAFSGLSGGGGRIAAYYRDSSPPDAGYLSIDQRTYTQVYYPAGGFYTTGSNYTPSGTIYRSTVDEPAFVFPAALTVPAEGSPGLPESTFSGDGLQLAAFPGAAVANAVVVQPDGKTVAVGYAFTAGGTQDVALMRYLPDGSPDATFGSGGQVTTAVGAWGDIGMSVALQSDGKILVAGYVSNASGKADCLLLRYHGDAATGTPGTLDASFGSGGVVLTAFGASNDLAYGVAVQTDGKILITGGATLGGTDDLILARYEANGALDSTFDGDGKVTLAFGPSTDHGYAVKVQADGKIVVAGFAHSGASPDFALARFLPNGSLDGTFGSAGKVLTDFFGIADDGATGLAIQDDGKIVMAGYANTGAGNYDFAVARYTANGALDTTFDGDGKATAAIGTTLEVGSSVVVQPDGKIVLAGYTQNASNTDMAVLRFNADGSLDGTFDGDGKVVLAPGSGHDFLYSVALAPDGDIVAAGYTHNGGGMAQFAVVRLLGLPDPLSVHFASASTIGSTALQPVLTGATLGPITLGFAPAPGTTLMLVQNTGAGFIAGQFSNLAPGQTMTLTHAGQSYNFVANYYGGTGNDLVLQWAGMGPVVWGAQNFDVRSYTPPFKAIAAGYSHTVALKTDGTVVAWGQNNYGQTTVPGGVSGVSAIAAGHAHTVALQTDGTVMAWGQNSFGQATVPGGLSGVSAIAAGGAHTVALKSDGTVVAWGQNNYGQTTVPAGLSGVSAIAAGGAHTVALKTDGTVVAWGYNASGQATVPAGLSGVSAIAAGGAHTVALKTDGTVVAWGHNSYGQTTVPAGLSGVSAIAAGDSNTVALQTDGTVVAWGDNSSGQTTVPGGLSGVSAIAAGGLHTVALRTDGTVVAWGHDYYGQTTVPAGLSGVSAIAAGGAHTVALKTDGTVVAWGHNYAGHATVPGGLSGVSAIAASDYHTVALKTDGTVVAWGSNGSGQTTVPGGLSGVSAIAAGYSHTVALKMDGTVVAWGDNGSGQTTVPAGLSGVSAIAAGDSHTVALKTDGTVVAWGHNGFGQATVPAGLSGVSAIAAGGAHTVALKTDGTVVAWGYNGFGQATVPAGLSGVSAIAAGDYHTVALQTDGTVVGWGENGAGQTAVPAGLSGVSAIAAGTYHTVALVPLPPAVAFVSLAGITASGATVNGTINPNWQATTAQVQYGTTGSYGSTAAIPLSPADGSATQSFSLPLSGLVPGTLYHFRISATSVSGTSVTADGTFTTLGYADIAVFAGPDDTAPELTDGQTEAVDFGSTGAGGAGVTRVLTLKNTGHLPLLLDNAFNAPAGWVADDYTSAPLAPGASRTLTLRFLPATVGPHAGTITLVSNDPDAEESFTFPVTGAGVDVTAPQVTNAEMTSDNSFNGGYASFWDTVSLSFTTNEPVQMPLVTLLGDNVVVTGGPTEWVATQIVGSTPPEGPVAFVITVTDLAGNATAPVTEALLDDLEVDNVIVDRTPPVVTPPADILVQETPGTGGAVVNFAATAADENGVLEISSLPAAGTFFVNGVHPVEVTALDNAGNVANVVHAFTVTVNAAPVAVADVTHGGPVAAGAFPIFVLANDTDAFGGALDITAVTQGAFGAVAAIEGGVEHLVYTPGPGYTGSDTFTYTISDGMGGTATGTVTLTNTAPAAYDATQAISEDTAPRIALSYADADGDLMTWALVTPPAHGTAVLEEGHYTYTPPLNYNGPDSFTFQVTDDRGMVSNVASITLDVTPVNDAPVVVDQSATTNEDTAVQIPLNGTDVENHTLSYQTGPPEHGTVSIAGGIATYTPHPNYHGPDSFAFIADDGQAITPTSTWATVFITVEPVTDDQDIALEDSAGTALASGGFLFVGGQDVNAGPRLVTVTIRNTGTDELSGLSLAVTDAFGGVSSVFGLETSPPPSIAAGGSETVQVWFDPGAVIGALGGQSNHSALLTVTSNDPDEGTYLVNLSGTGLQPVLSVSLVSSGTVITGPPWQGIYSRPFGRLAQGTSASETVRVTNNGPGLLTGEFQFGGSMPFYPSGPLTYALTFGQSQDFVVTYEWTLSGPHYAVLAVTSNDSTSLPTGMVNVSFSGQGNMPPTAADTAGSAIEDQSLPGGMVPLSASDSEGDALSFEFLTLPQHGTLYGFPAPGQTFFPSASPSLTYVPAPNYSGPDSFTYRVWDGYDYSPAATATITVLPVNDAPVATGRTVGTPEDTPITFSSEAMDPDGDALTYTTIGGPSFGTMTQSGNEFTYTPGENRNGTDSYTYQVSDGEFTATAVVTINVASVNDAPETSFDVFSVNEDATLTVTTTKRVLRNDSDLHNDANDEGHDPLTAVVENTPAHAAAFTFNTNGTFTYTPKPNFHGLDGFTYRAVDALGAQSEPETVLIAVWAVNDAPVAAEQSLTTLEDVPIPVRLRSADPDLLITFDPNAWLGIPPPNNGPAPHDADPIYTIVTAPQHGTLSSDGAQWIYTPNADFNGQDSFTFTFTASDGMAISNTATVTITVAPDSDGDALPDAWEISELGALTWDGSSDPDGDGQDNTFELIAGNNPADANSCLCMELASTTADGGVFRLNHVRSGVLYRLESSIDLTAWDTLSEATYEVEGPGAIYDSRAQGAMRRFYRVTVERFAGE